MNGKNSASASSQDDLQKVQIKKGQTAFSLYLPMQITTVTRNETIGVYRGPLLYAADIQYSSSSHQPLNWTDRTPLPDSEVNPHARDYVLEATSQWRYAIDPSTLRLQAEHPAAEVLPNPLFTRDTPPVSLEVDAYPIDWPETLGTAALPPVNPVVDRSTKTTLKLIPFGAAKIHIAQFPVAKFE